MGALLASAPALLAFLRELRAVGVTRAKIQGVGEFDLAAASPVSPLQAEPRRPRPWDEPAAADVDDLPLPEFGEPALSAEHADRMTKLAEMERRQAEERELYWSAQ